MEVEATKEGVRKFVHDAVTSRLPAASNFASLHCSSNSLQVTVADKDGTRRQFSITVTEMEPAPLNKQAQDAPGGCRPCQARKASAPNDQAQECGSSQEVATQEASEPAGSSG